MTPYDGAAPAPDPPAARPGVTPGVTPWRGARGVSQCAILRRFPALEDKHVPVVNRPSSSSRSVIPRPLVAGAALLGLALLPSCIPILAGGAAGGGYVAGQERGLVGAAKDTEIRALINDRWLKYDTEMTQQLSLSVYDGRVLVTGAVSKADWKVEAVRLAWQVEGVKKVDSEITLADKSSILDAARDELITTRLRSAILFDSHVRSVNYTIDVVNGIVYLTGSARTQGELDLVTGYARNIPNVKRVVSYVQIRPGEPGNSASDTQSTGQAAPAGAPPPPPQPNPAPVSTPTGPAKIEVQPLQ
jgi:osmotically-inducible protein OsmY